MVPRTTLILFLSEVGGNPMMHTNDKEFQADKWKKFKSHQNHQRLGNFEIFPYQTEQKFNNFGGFKKYMNFDTTL